MRSELNPLASIDAELADKLENDAAFRSRFIRAFAQAEVAAEIRTLRKKRRMRQQDLARLANTGQSAISRIEKADYEGWTYKTLIGVAEKLRARLRIRLEPIEDVAQAYREGDVANATGEKNSILRGVGTASKATADEPIDTATADSAFLFQGPDSGSAYATM